MTLVGWWQLDGNTKDGINGNDGSGSPTYVDGKIGQGIDGDGTNVSVSGSEIGSALSGNQMTLSLWWKQTGTNNYSDIISTSGFRLERGDDESPGSQSDYWCNWGAGSSDFSNEGVRLTNNDIGIPQGEWFHIVVRRKGSDLEVWINGERDASVSTDLAMSGYGDGFTINPEVSDSYFDDIRLYDHAISEKRITQLSRAKVLHYKLDTDGSVTDSSGQGNDGIINGPTFTQDSKIGPGAYDFVGSNQEYIRTSKNVPSGDPEVTLSVWAKANSVPQTDWTGILSLGTNQSTNTTFTITAGNNGDAVEVHTWGNSTPSISLDTNWHHYVAVNTGNGEQRFYADGELIGSMNQSLSIPDEKGAVGSRVYAIEDNNNQMWDGQIDDARIYTTELSDAEIQGLYETRASIDSGGTTHIHQLDEEKVSGGSFEDTPVGSTSSESVNFGLGGSSKIVDTTAYYGSKSLRGIDLGDSRWGTISYIYDETGSDPLMKDGETWTMSFYAKSNNSFDYSIGFAGGGGFLKENIQANSDWTYYETTDTISSTSNKFQRRDETDADGQIFFDNIRFRKESSMKEGSVTKKGQMDPHEFSEVGPAPESLVGWWPLDGNARDYSENANDGTNNGATVTSGLGQSAYDFVDTENDNIQVPSSSVFTEKTVSISVWMRPSSSHSGTTRIVYHEGDDSAMILADGSDLSIEHRAGSGDFSNAGSVTPDEWNHVVFVWDDSTDTFYNYTNGSLDVSGGMGGGYFSDNNGGLDIGTGHWTNDSSYFLGQLQDIRFHDRALTSEEVAQLYALTDPRTDQQLMQTQDGKALAKEQFNELI